MGKSLPYYQFEVAEYLAGDVMICSLEAQGLFSVIKCLYWQKECSLNVKQVLRRYDKKDLIDELTEEGCLKVDDDGEITINFLLAQYEQLTERKRKLSEAGKRGRSKQLTATPKPSPSKDETTLGHLEEIRRDKKKEDKKIENYRGFAHLSMSVVEFDKLISEGYTKQQIDSVIDNIENYKKNKNYNSLNLTVRSWLKRDGITPVKTEKKRSLTMEEVRKLQMS